MKKGRKVTDLIKITKVRTFQVDRISTSLMIKEQPRTIVEIIQIKETHEIIKVIEIEIQITRLTIETISIRNILITNQRITVLINEKMMTGFREAVMIAKVLKGKATKGNK